jgi:hypothetical protein
MPSVRLQEIKMNDWELNGRLRDAVEKIIEELEMTLPFNKEQLVLGIWGDKSILGAV